MILRPPAAPFDPWALGNTRFGESFIWIAAAVGLVFGVILLVDYFNTKRTSHLLWSISFIGIWIYFHTMISGGTYMSFLTPNMQSMFSGFIAMLLYLIPALLAAGLVYEVFEDKRIGNYFMLFVTIMVFLIFIFKIDPAYGQNVIHNDVPGPASTRPPFGPTIDHSADIFILEGYAELCILILLSPSYAAIIALPLIKAEGTKLSLKVTPAELILSIAGIIAAIFGIMVASIAWQGWTNADTSEFGLVNSVLDTFSFFLLGAVILGLYGIITSKRWEVQVPGIEFETRA